ncbi:hypothetical protein [Sphingomonas sp. Mn802worker]|uniref:hypothetical protein n=1 Tax=Sphingomonas sp. Mn802worker TaxID=629773 RepID=UPI00037CDB1A|nr:hypothetical protein [Sphingomonas sp. Mn802worker]
MTALLLFVVAAGIALVRLGWSGPRLAAAIGWALAVVALVALAWSDGAWGLAVGVVVGMAVALTCVLYAGWRSPVRERRAARDAPAISIPHHRRDVVRRLAVFALVVPIAFVAAQWLAFGMQAAVRGGGELDSDSVVLTLFLQPVIWTALLTVQLTRARPAQMVAAPLIAGIAGTILWGVA